MDGLGARHEEIERGDILSMLGVMAAKLRREPPGDFGREITIDEWRATRGG